MLLLFFLAGMTSWHALEFHGGGSYLKEWFQRLVVPLVFGLIVIVPPQAYLARFKQPDYNKSYFGFLLDYFRIRRDMLGFTGLFTPGHLWIILYLFVFSVIALPLFLYLKRKPEFIIHLAKCCQHANPCIARSSVPWP